MAGEVAEGVIVFEVGESAQGHRARIPRIALGDFGERGIDPGDEGGFFGGEQFVRVFGGHLSGFDDVANFLPESEFFFDLRLIEQGLKIDAAFGFFVVVTGKAGRIQSGRDGFPVGSGMGWEDQKGQK